MKKIEKMKKTKKIDSLALLASGILLSCSQSIAAQSMEKLPEEIIHETQCEKENIEKIKGLLQKEGLLGNRKCGAGTLCH